MLRRWQKYVSFLIINPENYKIIRNIATLLVIALTARDIDSSKIPITQTSFLFNKRIIHTVFHV